jgi:hypothetical protein
VQDANRKTSSYVRHRITLNQKQERIGRRIDNGPKTPANGRTATLLQALLGCMLAAALRMRRKVREFLIFFLRFRTFSASPLGDE